MLNLDPVTERSLIAGALSAGVIWGVLKTTVKGMNKRISDLNDKVNCVSEKANRMQRNLDKLTTAHLIHHGEALGNGNNV